MVSAAQSDSVFTFASPRTRNCRSPSFALNAIDTAVGGFEPCEFLERGLQPRVLVPHGPLSCPLPLPTGGFLRDGLERRHRRTRVQVKRDSSHVLGPDRAGVSRQDYRARVLPVDSLKYPARTESAPRHA